MFNFFHSIIVKIAVGISSVALFFSGAAATPPLAPQNATSSAQIEIVATSSTTAATTKKTETSAKQDAPKDNKDSLIGSLKKQVADLTQKASQPKVEAPKTSVITLPSGAVVEMDANGNVVRTITPAPQQTYVAPTPTTQNQPTPAANSAPVSRTLEASLQPNAGEIHTKTGEAVARAALFPFTLKASGNADTHVSKIKFRTLGPTRFTDMWIESTDGTYIGNKVDATSVFSGGYGYVPVSITLTPGKTSNFTLYVDVPAGAAKSSGVEQLYMEGITSDAGSMSDFPLSGNASLWYDKVIAPAPHFVGVPVATFLGNNAYQFTWQSDISVTVEWGVCARLLGGGASGAPRVGDECYSPQQTQTGTGGVFNVEIGPGYPYYIKLKANDQITTAYGFMPQSTTTPVSAFMPQ